MGIVFTKSAGLDCGPLQPKILQQRSHRETVGTEVSKAVGKVL